MQVFPIINFEEPEGVHKPLSQQYLMNQRNSTAGNTNGAIFVQNSSLTATPQPG